LGWTCFPLHLVRAVHVRNDAAVALDMSSSSRVISTLYSAVYTLRLRTLYCSFGGTMPPATDRMTSDDDIMLCSGRLLYVRRARRHRRRGCRHTSWSSTRHRTRSWNEAGLLHHLPPTQLLLVATENRVRIYNPRQADAREAAGGSSITSLAVHPSEITCSRLQDPALCLWCAPPLGCESTAVGLRVSELCFWLCARDLQASAYELGLLLSDQGVLVSQVGYLVCTTGRLRSLSWQQ
jgi:hypothetical protein